MEALNEGLMEQGVPGAIRLCGNIMPLGSTAVCGKPHVRWCGRGPVTSPAPDPIVMCKNGQLSCQERYPEEMRDCQQVSNGRETP